MKRIYLALIMLISMLACQKAPEKTPDGPDTPPENTVIPIRVSASFAETIIDGLPKWTGEDTISFFGAGKVNRKLIISFKDGSNAEFSGDGDTVGPFFGIWPYSADASLSGSVVTAKVPAVQKLAGGAVAPGAMVAVAYAEEQNLPFKNVCGLLQIEIKDSDITSIFVQSVDGAALAGKFSVDAKTGVISKVDEPVSQISLLPAAATFAPGTYYIAAIPGSYGDLRIALARKTDVKKGTKTAAKAELERSKALSLGNIDASGVEWSYFINDYEELKAWVADKTHWNPEGETVTLTGDINMKDEPWTPLSDSYPGTFDGGHHCISHVNIQSNELANVGFFGKNYAKVIKNVVFGSEDGETYDGTSVIKNGYNTTSTSAYWSYTGIVTLPAANIDDVTNFIPITVLKGSNRSSRVGGIAGWATGKVAISDCKNYGPITIEDHAITSGSSYKYLAAGGILGGCNTASAEVLVGDCVNYAKIHSSNHSEYGMGGIVGLIYSTTTAFVLDCCRNEGDVEQEYTATQNDIFTIGGIIGKVACKTGATIPLIQTCSNKGHIYSEAVHQHFVGGIAGHAEGVSILQCTNEGTVEINHNKQASTRFQNIGGILGAAMSGGGNNTVCGNKSNGEIIMKVASSGHNKTPASTTTFYGVNAGGVVGMAESLAKLERNECECNLKAENGFSDPIWPSTLYVGGILGYDYGTVESFLSNTFKGSLDAKITNSRCADSELCVGGIVGKLKSATVSDIHFEGDIKADIKDIGTVYAGGIAGYSTGAVSGYFCSGTVNGIDANYNRIVGGGNQPGDSGTNPPIQGGTFGVSETSISFEGTGFSKQDLVVTAGEKALSISAEGLDWLKTESIPTSVEAGQGVSIPILPRTGNIDEQRSGTLTVKEDGGETRTVAISQGTISANVEGFPARWEIAKGVTYTEGNAAGQRWLKEGIAETTKVDDITSTSPGVGYISAGSGTPGHNVVYSVAPSGTQNISIGNLDEGDYIQFSVPTVSMPAGTDIDFMVTINTNNNKTPKYWLFEYWDDGKWVSQPRYTATEDANIKYSLDVYDYDSKNHRTYITTFRLTKPVSNDFVKMRLRAVGKINCSGGALVPTSNAYMNFPCTTYRSCEIVAYPGIAAKESTPVKILQLGNSFTYYHGSAFKLKQICRAEGHATDVRINVKGSQEFAEHLDVLPFSQRVVAEGGYDKAIIQDGSYYHAEYTVGKDALKDVTPEYTPEEILAYTKRLSAAIKEKSPNSKVILESVWSYSYKSTGGYLGFGSFEAFDAAQWQGSNAIAAADPNVDIVSPIGKAFALARSQYGFNSAYNWLLYTDNYHPNRYGSYLKACVNYLILFGERFGSHPADCDVPAAEAAKLREIATKIVFGE